MNEWYQKKILPRLLKSAMGRSEFEKIRPTIISKAEGVVLEIGVGAGNNFPYYKNVSKLYALEPSAELVEMAKAQPVSMPVEFLVSRAERIPLPDHSIDTAVSTWTLCSVDDPKAVLREIRRLLRPGGKFLFVDHGLSRNSFVLLLQKILTPFTKHFTGNCHMDRNIERLVCEAGFDISTLSHPREHFKPLVYNYQGVATSQ